MTMRVSTGSEEEDKMTSSEEAKKRPGVPDCLLTSVSLPLRALPSTAGARSEKLHFPESPANSF